MSQKPDADDPPFDAALAESLLGKHVLVGITYVDQADHPTGTRQLHGHIVRIDPREGVVILVYGTSEEFALPPDFGAFQVASPGEYRLRSTGEVVRDPDFTCTWTLKPPVRH